MRLAVPAESTMVTIAMSRKFHSDWDRCSSRCESKRSVSSQWRRSSWISATDRASMDLGDTAPVGSLSNACQRLETRSTVRSKRGSGLRCWMASISCTACWTPNRVVLCSDLSATVESTASSLLIAATSLSSRR